VCQCVSCVLSVRLVRKKFPVCQCMSCVLFRALRIIVLALCVSVLVVPFVSVFEKYPLGISVLVECPCVSVLIMSCVSGYE
jgi:hypothetical protein